MVRHTPPTCGSASCRGHLPVIGHIPADTAGHHQNEASTPTESGRSRQLNLGSPAKRQDTARSQATYSWQSQSVVGFFPTICHFPRRSGPERTRIWPTAITGLEPAAVTESQRQPGRPPCEIGAERRFRAAASCVAGAGGRMQIIRLWAPQAQAGFGQAGESLVRASPMIRSATPRRRRARRHNRRAHRRMTAQQDRVPLR